MGKATSSKFPAKINFRRESRKFCLLKLSTVNLINSAKGYSFKVQVCIVLQCICTSEVFIFLFQTLSLVDLYPFIQSATENMVAEGGTACMEHLLFPQFLHLFKDGKVLGMHKLNDL